MARHFIMHKGLGNQMLVQQAVAWHIMGTGISGGRGCRHTRRSFSFAGIREHQARGISWGPKQPGAERQAPWPSQRPLQQHCHHG